MLGAVVFLHGSGDTGGGIKSWIQSVSPTFLSSLESQGIKVVFPSAAARPYTMAGGSLSTVWHDRQYLSSDAPEDAVGLSASRAVISAVVSDLLSSDGLPASAVVVGGFSMGGGTSLHACLQGGGGGDNGLNGVAGVFSMSSFVTSKSSLWIDLATRTTLNPTQPTPPVFMTHGSHDSMIGVRWATETADRLKQTGLTQVDFYEEPYLDHEPGPQSLELLQTWILAKIVKPTTP